MKPAWYTILKKGDSQLKKQQMAVGDCADGGPHQFEKFKQTVRPDTLPRKLPGYTAYYNGPPQYDLIVQACMKCKAKRYVDMRASG